MPRTKQYWSVLEGPRCSGTTGLPCIIRPSRRLPFHSELKPIRIFQQHREHQYVMMGRGSVAARRAPHLFGGIPWFPLSSGIVLGLVRANRHQVGGVSRSPDRLFAQQELEPIRGRPAVRGKSTFFYTIFCKNF